MLHTTQYSVVCLSILIVWISYIVPVVTGCIIVYYYYTIDMKLDHCYKD